MVDIVKKITKSSLIGFMTTNPRAIYIEDITEFYINATETREKIKSKVNSKRNNINADIFKDAFGLLSHPSSPKA